MATKKTVELDFEFPAQGKKPKRSSKKFTKIFLIASAGVLVVALAVAAVLLTQDHQTAVRIMDFGTVLKGVSVGGVDISGMTRDEALAATADLSEQMLAKANFKLDVNGEQFEYSAHDFALYTDYEKVIEQAVSYGRMGSFDERFDAAANAKEAGIDFPVKVLVDEAGLKAALATFKAEMDTQPVDATAIFAPWGYSETIGEGGKVTYTPYTPDVARIIDYCSAISKGKEYTKFPEFVRMADADMPNPLRYEYWNDRKGSDGGYEKENVPRDANVSRFIYTEEVTGLVVDIDAIEASVKSQVESDTYETFAVPVQVTPATVTLEQIKSQTQMIASWSSSYGGSGHQKDYDRNYNVAMIASLLNGTVIEPGETWSVNETTGKRNKGTQYRWRQASGIENGGYSPQYGGGVCQLGSTTYNAAIRSGLYIEESHHHSIPSAYVPLGLDATINSTSLDLKLRNDAATPVYMVTYNNPTERCVTVEFYGVPLTDATGQQILLTYTNKNLGRYGSPKSKVVPVPLGYKCPDDTIITLEKQSYQYAEDRRGTKVQVYKITKTLDGTQISKEDFGSAYSYPTINGTTYVLRDEDKPPVDPPPVDPPPVDPPPAG